MQNTGVCLSLKCFYNFTQLGLVLFVCLFVWQVFCLYIKVQSIYIYSISILSLFLCLNVFVLVVQLWKETSAKLGNTDKYQQRMSKPAEWWKRYTWDFSYLTKSISLDGKFALFCGWFQAKTGRFMKQPEHLGQLHPWVWVMPLNAALIRCVKPCKQVSLPSSVPWGMV